MFTNLKNKITKTINNFTQKLFPESSLKQTFQGFLNIFSGLGNTFLSFGKLLKSLFFLNLQGLKTGKNLGQAGINAFESISADTPETEDKTWKAAVEEFNQAQKNFGQGITELQNSLSAGSDVLTNGLSTLFSGAETLWHAGRSTANGLQMAGSGVKAAADSASNVAADLVARAAALVSGESNGSNNSASSLPVDLQAFLPAFKAMASNLPAIQQQVNSQNIELADMNPAARNTTAPAA